MGIIRFIHAIIVCKVVIPLVDIEFIADRIAQLRIAKGVSARDMSLSIGQSENYINHIENKKSLPSMQAFFYICEYLRIEPKDFFDDENGAPNEYNEAVKKLKRLNRKQLELVLALADEIKPR